MDIASALFGEVALHYDRVRTEGSARRSRPATRVHGLSKSGKLVHRRLDLAMALVDVEHAQVGEVLHTHVVGVERGARIIESSPYDPDGVVMRR